MKITFRILSLYFLAISALAVLVVCFNISGDFELKKTVKEGDYRGQHYVISKDSKGFYPEVNGISVSGKYPCRSSHYITVDGATAEAFSAIDMESSK